MNKIEVWVTDGLIVNIAGDKETIRIEMPDVHLAMKLLETLLTSKDVQQG